MDSNFILIDLLKTIRSLNNQMQIIQALDLSEKERKVINNALIKLNEDIEKAKV